jgi:hypothetical protein
MPFGGIVQPPQSYAFSTARTRALTYCCVSATLPTACRCESSLEELNDVLFGDGSGGSSPGTELFVAREMLPRMQGRLWSASERADITATARKLRETVESVASSEDDGDLMDLADDDKGGLPWATYVCSGLSSCSSLSPPPPPFVFYAALRTCVVRPCFFPLSR